LAGVKVGKVDVLSFSDLRRGMPVREAFPAVAASEWERYASLYPDGIAGGIMTGPVSAFVLRTPAETVLIDMGIGPGPFPFFGGASGALGQALNAAGIDPAAVDIVVFTHLHSDHTGWTIKDGKAFCSKARHIAPEGDWPLLGQPRFGAVEPFQQLLNSGQLELVSGERQVTREIGLIPTPGHTPGHQSVTIVSEGERGFIAGDLAVSPVSVEETDWAFAMDSEPDTAIRTRRAVMSRLESEEGIVGFAHFPEPGLGRIVRENGLRLFKSL
jgi:glyoxylase-like metal-dependent hydrolase (beta-lactamase superfamily II)